jgi:hypothetical protein
MLTSEVVFSTMLRHLLTEGKRHILLTRSLFICQDHRPRVVVCFDGSEGAFRQLQQLAALAPSCELILLMSPFVDSAIFVKSTRKMLAERGEFREVGGKLVVLPESESD